MSLAPTKVLGIKGEGKVFRLVVLVRNYFSGKIFRHCRERCIDCIIDIYKDPINLPRVYISVLFTYPLEDICKDSGRLMG